MKIIIAPNAFKSSLSAEDAAIAIEQGLLEANPGFTSVRFPVADGGDGTGGLLRKKLKANTVHAIVHDPLGRKIESTFGFVVDKKIAIIEMADASGLRLINQSERDPMASSSYGTGELIRNALDLHANTIILCIGGTATVDGGMGILEALGATFIFRSDKPGKVVPARMADLLSMDLSGMDHRLGDISLKILCDVVNPLLGASGAAQVFSPQKGATPDQVILLEKGLIRLEEILFESTGRRVRDVQHGGAGGGTAAILHGVLNGDLENGIEYFLNITGFMDEIKGADLIITGEGSLDSQTLLGKGPMGVARLGKKAGVRVVALAGAVQASSRSELAKYFDDLIVINQYGQSLEQAMSSTQTNLRTASRNLGRRISG